METITLSPAGSPELLDYARRSDWRDMALAQALLEEARGSEGEDALLSAIRLYHPQAVTAMVYLDRARLLEFAQKHADSGSAASPREGATTGTPRVPRAAGLRRLVRPRVAGPAN